MEQVFYGSSRDNQKFVLWLAKYQYEEKLHSPYAWLDGQNGPCIGVEYARHYEGYHLDRNDYPIAFSARDLITLTVERQAEAVFIPLTMINEIFAEVKTVVGNPFIPPT